MEERNDSEVGKHAVCLQCGHVTYFTAPMDYEEGSGMYK